MGDLSKKCKVNKRPRFFSQGKTDLEKRALRFIMQHIGHARRWNSPKSINDNLDFL